MANTYRFGDDRGVSILMGLGVRQVAPLTAGFVWLALWMQAGLVAIGGVGFLFALVAAFGRWRGFPIAEIASPAVRHRWRILRGHRVWVRHSLLGTNDGAAADVPVELSGLELLEVPGVGIVPHSVGVIHDVAAHTLSLSLRVAGRGFAVADPASQDLLLDGWGAVLSPLARERCPVAKVVWQQWAHPAGIGEHRDFLASCASANGSEAARDYERLLLQQAPFVQAHEVLLTLVVDVRRVRARRRVAPLTAAIESLLDETRLLVSRVENADLVVESLLSPTESSLAIRLRSDPGHARSAQVVTLNRSLAAASGRVELEWGPMALGNEWGHVRVDGSLHRSYRVASWPMLPMTADWLGHLLTGDDQSTRTVTVVLEPVPMRRAAQAANRELASLEADASEKEERKFRVTANERRRIADVETRERELSVGHAEFTFVGLVTVTACDLDELDDACARVEQSAAQALMDLRPLDARHHLGFVASLPLGRDVRSGRWS